MLERENSYGLLSIKNKILFFTVLVTIIPSLSVGLLLHNMLYSTLEEKVEQKFSDSAEIMERELKSWFKDRLSDLKAFSDTSIIIEGVPGSLTAEESAEPNSDSQARRDPAVYIQTIETYLNSIQKQFDEYVHIRVLRGDGTTLASIHNHEHEGQHHFHLPEDALYQIQDKEWFRGDVFYHGNRREPLMTIGIPLFAENQESLKAMLVAEVKLSGLQSVLEAEGPGGLDDGAVYRSFFMLKDGQPFMEKVVAEQSMDVGESASQKRISTIAPYQTGLHELTSDAGVQLMGMMVPVDSLEWGIFLAMDYEQVFSGAIESRNRNLLVVVLLAVIIGIVASVLARQITKPLSLLTQAANQVAGGDLEVKLQVRRSDEIGFATSVFNEMVVKLKENQDQLEQLATTDSLTGLLNRKQLMGSLKGLFEYYQRYSAEFSLLMVDVDHFKAVNDTYGHQAGDAVLQQIAMIFQDNIRNVDMAGRYGGEEFLLILPESDEEKSLQVANRIRMAVERHLFTFEAEIIRLQVSIGVGRIAPADQNVDSVLRRADVGLYKAKKNGRNQVVYITGDENGTTGGGKVVAINSK